MPVPFKREIARVHITTLCRTNGIAIRWVSGRNWLTDAESSEKARLVHIPKPHNSRQYMVALHEIGHLLGYLGVSERAEHPGVSALQYWVLAEASAWAWAIEHIHPDLDWGISYVDWEKTLGRGMVSHTWAAAHTAAHG